METEYKNIKRAIKLIEQNKSFNSALTLCKRLLKHCEFLAEQLDERDLLLETYSDMVQELLDMVKTEKKIES